MRKFIGRILKWFLHEHEWVTMYRLISRYEYPEHLASSDEDRGKIKHGWFADGWQSMLWAQRCKTCGKRRTEHFNSDLPLRESVFYGA